MERDGLVRAGRVGLRDKRPYELTDVGRAAFAEWIDREPGPENIRYPLLLTLAFARHLRPERLREFLAHHREVHAARLEEYEALQGQVAGNLDAYASATLDFGVRYERAVLDWFDNLPPDVTGVRS
jgi:DNA-binding PadR family transcriptional regulator